jgi:hypothetical protein
VALHESQNFAARLQNVPQEAGRKAGRKKQEKDADVGPGKRPTYRRAR